MPSRLRASCGCFLVLLAVVALRSEARACSICGCGDPLLVANDPAAITGTLRVQLDTEYLRVNAGTDGQPGYTDELTQWSYRLNAVYRPISRLSLMVTAPLLDKSIRTVGPGVDQSDSSLFGLGDVELAARYTLWKRIGYANGRYQEIGLAAGSALPTGANDARTTDAAGNAIPIDPHGQLGTGGLGPFVGLHYRFEQADWTGFADLSYRVRTTGDYFDGSRYKFGNAALWSLHAQYRVLRALAFDLGIDGRYARADQATDADGVVTDKVENTGGTVLSAAPGVYVNAAGSLWVFVRGQIPFYKSLDGEQDVKPSVALGLQYQAL
jgi:hypothetical protein